MYSTELQYVIVRYMHNELADEAANVGLVAVSDDPPRVHTKFLPDPNAKSRVDARVQSDAIERFRNFAESQCDRFQRNGSALSDRAESLLKVLTEFGAGVVRTSPPRSVLTNDFDAEVELLYAQLVAPKERPSRAAAPHVRDPLGGLRREARAAIVSKVRETVGAPLKRTVFVKSYELRGQRHKNTFDLAVVGGTKQKRVERIFHHLLVLPDPEESFDQAAALCWRWADIAERNGVNRELTAVAFSRKELAAHVLPDASKALKEEGIELARLDDVPRLIRKLRLDSQLKLFVPVGS